MKNLSIRTARCAGMAALVLTLVGCGSGDGVEPTDPAREQGLAVSRPGDLVRVVQAKLRARQAQWQATPGVLLDAMPVSVAAPSPTAAAGAAPARSGPLAQEQGVDEADILQTDGDHLFTLQPAGVDAQRLQVHARGSDGHARLLATLTLSSGSAASVTGDGMHLSADGRALAVISQAWVPLSAGDACPSGCGAAATLPALMGSRVDVQRVDLSAPAAPEAGERLSIDGNLVDSRRIGDALYVVTSYRPWLYAEALPANASAAAREAAIAAVTAADVMPRVRRNGGAPEALLAEAECYVQAANASLAIEITTVTVFDLRSPTLARSSRCFVGGTEALYMTTGSLYLATTRYAYQPTAGLWAYPAEIKTDLHKFALAAGGVQYRGSGQVSGHLGWDSQRKSFRLSEHEGDLRVLSFTGSFGWMGLQDASNAGTPPSPAQLTVLREHASDQTLQPVATLPNAKRPASLGKPGEQVYGVRFVGARAYVVTFRRMDPLYVLDLADAADPRIAGELELAGFSESLFPLDGGLLLGVGRDAEANGRITGLKVALFDVADAARPRVLAFSSFGGASSSMALDSSRHGLNLLVKDGVARIALPVNLAPPGTSFSADGWQHGLLRFEVDTRARKLAERSMLGGALGDFNHPTWRERSLQIGEQVHYLGSAGLSSHDW